MNACGKRGHGFVTGGVTRRASMPEMGVSNAYLASCVAIAMRWCQGLVCAVLFGVCCVIFAPTAQANMAKPWDDGDVIGEPLGAWKSLHVVREDLQFDLRVLAEKKANIKVRATYQIDNRAAAVKVPLFFVAPGLKSGTVKVDTKSVVGTIERRVVPESWRVQYGEEKSEGMLFEVELGPGEHVIEVAYEALPQYDHSSSRVYQDARVRYVLAPVKQWASFGELHVEVLAPDGWPVEQELGLKQEGGVWRKSFEELPGDTLEISVPFPVPFGVHLATWALWIVLVLGLILGAAVAWRFSFATQENLVRRWFSVVGLGLLQAALFAGILWGSWLLGLAVLDESLSSRSWSYGRAIVAIVLVLPGGSIGQLLLYFLVSFVRRQWWHRRAPSASNV